MADRADDTRQSWPAFGRPRRPALGRVPDHIALNKPVIELDEHGGYTLPVTPV